MVPSGAILLALPMPLGSDSTLGLAGPVGTPDGGLYFTDNRANKILLLDRKGKITVVHENTNNANGLVLTKSGDLLEVQGAGKRVNRRSRDGKVTALTESVGGQPFLAPNDLIADAKGGIYFTDPGPRPEGRPQRSTRRCILP